jgi:hypothetical protein
MGLTILLGFIWLALPQDNKKIADIQFLLIWILLLLLFLTSFAITMTPGFCPDLDGCI